MELLAFCHTIITQKKNNELQYNAASPDELALVNMAKYCGFEYAGKDDDNNMVVKHHQKGKQVDTLTKKLHYVLEFTSKRKR